MNKFFNIMLILVFLPKFVFACMFPNHGEEYDTKIKIEKLENENQYRVSLPRIIGDSSGWPILTLVYSSYELEQGCKEETLPDGTQLVCLPKEEIREELVLQGLLGKTKDWIIGKKLYEGEFKIKDKKNYSVKLSVMWETSACLTFGRKVIVD